MFMISFGPPQTKLRVGRRKMYLEIVERDLLVLNDDGDLELGHAVADSDELGETPDEAVLLDGADGRLERLHVGLVVPGLDVEGDDGLRGDSASASAILPRLLTLELPDGALEAP